MSNIHVLPSTLDGIKRRAKTIKRELNLSHHQALDEAARQAGFENIRHAQRAIPRQAPNGRLPHPVYLSAYWRQRDGRAGCETLRLLLPAPLSAFGTAAALRRARNLDGFKLEFSDHLEREVNLETQGDARLVVLAAARTLKFMAATGLQPASRALEDKLWARFHSLPGRDHGSCWVDATSGEGVFLNEPYGHASNAGASLDGLLAWVDAAGLQLVDTAWEGLYSPGSTRPFLYTETLALASRLQQQLNGLPAERPTGESPAWTGRSGAYEPFVSLERERQGRPRRPRPEPAQRGVVRAGALPYGAPRGGMRSRWRPAKPMPLPSHLTIGPLLAALSNSDLPEVASRRLREVRTDLDDWLQMEYPGDKMTDEQFRAAYYGEYRAPIATRTAQLAAVDRILALLEDGYSNCAPRRQVAKRLADARVRIAAV
jgi:hypothetical protein